MKREKFGSRLGFILISAGCAIGLGNVWRFPYITGKYGGAAFVLIYLLFLVLLGLPIMVMEFAVGRGSQASIALSFDRLEPLGTKWHWYKWFGIGGNYLLMMFYTTIGGWLLLYTGKMAIGEFKGLDADGVTGVFTSLLGQPVTMTICMILVVVLCFGIVCMGLQKGVEQITKKMMILLFVLMIIRSDGTGILYIKSWNRCDCDLWKLYRKRKNSDRRSSLRNSSGYISCIDRWIYYFSGLLCI